MNFLCLKVKWGKGRNMEENIAEGRRTEQRGMESFWEKKVSFLTLNALWSPLTKKSGKQGPVLQTEYEWCGEHCSGNNKVAKSLSPQAPHMAHLDLMAGVLSALVPTVLSLSEHPPIFLFAPAIYNPAHAICYFPCPRLPICSLCPTLYLLSFHSLFRRVLSSPLLFSSLLYHSCIDS